MFKRISFIYEGHEFVIDYPTKVEDYQLAISNNKIVIGVSYYAPYQMPSKTAAEIFTSSLRALHQEVLKIMNLNIEFYKDFNTHDFFEGLLSHSYPNFGRELAISNHTALHLTKKGSFGLPFFI